MKSLGAMVKQLGGMVDTVDLTTKDNAFVKKMVSVTRDGRDTRMLTEGQVKYVTDLYNRNFGESE